MFTVDKLGSKSVKISEKGKEIIAFPAIKIKNIKDATGARAALILAALKLQNVGR